MATSRTVWLVQVRNRARLSAAWRAWWRHDFYSTEEQAKRMLKHRSGLVDVRVVPYDRRPR